MSRFVLIPGAGGEASYWHRVVPLLEARGHQAMAVDLPGPDPAAGLPEYTEIVLAAIGDGRDHVIVAQSLGAFSGAGRLRPSARAAARARQRDDPGPRRNARRMVRQHRRRGRSCLACAGR